MRVYNHIIDEVTRMAKARGCPHSSGITASGGSSDEYFSPEHPGAVEGAFKCCPDHWGEARIGGLVNQPGALRITLTVPRTHRGLDDGKQLLDTLLRAAVERGYPMMTGDEGAPRS